jgi:glycosyltransferase involved in cell wall biosynthesis
MLRHALKHCAGIATVSEYNRRKLIQDYGAPSNRVEVIRQILNLEQFQSSPKTKILAVGFFSEKKGYDVLFEAFKLLGREDVELWVVGEAAPDRNVVDCRGLADRLGISQQVAFFGQQRGVALRALYRECDIFCLPSRTDRFGDKEGFPNVIAEAMAFGKPVVSTFHAGIPEVVEASALVKENDPRELAAALKRACDSAEWRTSHGQRNRRTVERLFSDANNDRLIQMLLECAERGPSPGDTMRITSDASSTDEDLERIEAWRL